MANNVEVSKEYVKLTQIEHILKRPDTYVGSTKKQNNDLWVVEGNFEQTNFNDLKVVKKNVEYVPAFIKIFDEILTNASDHYWKTLDVKTIKIKIDSDKITIENDGCGIPVIMHETENVYIPELIFSHLLSGSNFDDTKKRYGGGRNGYGAKLTNIYSNKFIIETSDGKLKYKQTYKNNMNDKTKHIISESDKNYTKIVYYPDFSRFEMDKKISDSTLSILLKRCIDVAAYCPKVKVIFNGKTIPIKTMKDWCQLHINENELFFYDINENIQIAICKSVDNSFEQVSIANGISTHTGGSYVNEISRELSKTLQIHLKKKYSKLKFTWQNVKSNLFLFVIAKIVNPSFSTQTKEYLTNNVNEYLPDFIDYEFKKPFVNKVLKSDICESIINFMEAKEIALMKRESKSLKGKKIDKLIEAKKFNQNSVLFLYEGMSAISQFRKHRYPHMGAFPLKGKLLNVNKAGNDKIIADDEVKKLMASIGLVIGEKAIKDKLKYKKIYISTDADHDGDAITGLIINFFYYFWPELFEQKMIFKLYTPLVVVTNKKNVKNYFYCEEDYLNWIKNKKTANYSISYKKGLASLEEDEYRMMFEEPQIDLLVADSESEKQLNIWFGKETYLKKEIL